MNLHARGVRPAPAAECDPPGRAGRASHASVQPAGGLSFGWADGRRGCGRNARRRRGARARISRAARRSTPTRRAPRSTVPPARTAPLRTTVAIHRATSAVRGTTPAVLLLLLLRSSGSSSSILPRNASQRIARSLARSGVPE
eukprot:scaffold5027_cov255-Prasinococcus_capsulatus_cf.AAC.5